MRKLLSLSCLAALAVLGWNGSAYGQAPPGDETTSPDRDEVDLREVLQLSVADSLAQLRAAPVDLGEGQPRAFQAVHSASPNVDPWHAYFRFPEHSLKLTLFTTEGKIRWQRDLGPGVVAGTWFAPVLPFDLNEDGRDEIWLVGNNQPEHPLSLYGMRLKRLDARTGETTGEWDWPRPASGQSMSHTYRFYILGGYADGEPVLVTAQGTYGPMRLQGWNPNMSRRWEREIGADQPGPRGSHMVPVVDINNDDVDEILWGERAISTATGESLFVADEETWNGHSDLILPLRDPATGEWSIFTARETPSPGNQVVMYDAEGERLWSDVEGGHMDRGWIARLGEERTPVAMAARLEKQGEGMEKQGFREFAYHPETGETYALPYDKYRDGAYRTIPVDLDGDAWHEITRNGVVIDRNGQQVATYDGEVAMASKFLDHAGEQLLTWTPDGRVHIYAHANARDSNAAEERYQHPSYQLNQQFTAFGYNLVLLGGI